MAQRCQPIERLGLLRSIWAAGSPFSVRSNACSLVSTEWAQLPPPKTDPGRSLPPGEVFPVLAIASARKVELDMRHVNKDLLSGITYQ
jgi:hypothetical protein